MLVVVKVAFGHDLVAAVKGRVAVEIWVDDGGRLDEIMEGGWMTVSAVAGIGAVGGCWLCNGWWWLGMEWLVDDGNCVGWVCGGWLCNVEVALMLCCRDPEWADVKLAQAKYLLSRLALFRTLVSNRLECMPSVVVAVDFNSTPGDKVYQYLISGNSPLAPAVECLEDMPIPLCSVYASTRGEPTFTNCTPDFTNTLDYILFPPIDNIKAVSFLELPELNSSDVVGGLPNYSHPSDHLPIGAEFEITRD
ncbi:hypothetical protein SO802_022492 [Lithocarpus litseifolius]|uniref:Endonuclease/exonuclease/phosphatase domain-containing protein n=1 Tax=Lithocarpus litseifolius TaxID=425828 RepID=A0AAW2C6M6_9ROSI